MKKITSLLVIFFTIMITDASSQGTWTQIANFGGGSATEARAFGIGDFGYVGAATPDFWQYDPLTDTWTQKAAFIGTQRNSAVGFSIGTKGYFGTGGNLNDFYEYDQATNTWTQKANFGGTAREGAVGCATNGKGYLGTGGSYKKDWWEYDPVTDFWTQKADLTGPTRYHGGSFAINGLCYVSTGFNGSFYNDLWEYNPATNIWTAKAPLPGPTRDRPVGLAVNGKGYIITGWTGSTALNDAWEYDPVANMWSVMPPMPGAARYNACGFVAGSALYVGVGYAGGAVADFYKYAPACAAQFTHQDPSCYGTCNGIATVSFPAPGPGVSYAWSTGATTQTINAICAGTYTVTVTDSAGCTSINNLIIDQPDSMEVAPNYVSPTCYGDSTGVICIQITGGTQPIISYMWSNGATANCIQGVAGGSYQVSVTDNSGCDQTFPLVLTQPAQIQLSFFVLDASCSTCPNGVASVNVNGGISPLTYNWSNGSNQQIQSNLLPGVYSVCVTDSNQCVQCDSVVVSFTSSLQDDGEIVNLNLAPNPTMNQFTITGNLLWNSLEVVELIDLKGLIITPEFVIQKNSCLVVMPEIASGVYVVRLITADRSFITRVVKYNE